MKLEDQVCSLELAKRLKELGVKQKSYFSYTEQEGYIGLEHWELRRAASGADIICSAFTVAELGEMLGKETSRISFYTGDHNWRYWLDIGREEYSDTEANARAKMLIYLLENGLVKV